jgi:hypothetical protein
MTSHFYLNFQHFLSLPLSSFLICLDLPSILSIGLPCSVHSHPIGSDGVSKSICFRIKSGFLHQLRPSKLSFIMLASHAFFPIAGLYASFYQSHVGVPVMSLLGVGDKNLLPTGLYLINTNKSNKVMCSIVITNM